MKSLGKVLRQNIGKSVTIEINNTKKDYFLMSEILVKLENFEFKPNYLGCYFSESSFNKKTEDVDIFKIDAVYSNNNKLLFSKKEFLEYLKKEKQKLN